MGYAPLLLALVPLRGVALAAMIAGVLLITGVFGTRLGVAIGAVGLAMSALPMFTRRIRSLRRLQPEPVG